MHVLHVPPSNNWGFPKGKIEAGETESECASRETLEETNISIPVNVIDKGRRIVAGRHVYFVVELGDYPQISLDYGELKDYRWIDIETFDNV